MVLVTGATGNVGREVVKHLNQAGCQVRVLTRNPEKISFPFHVDIIRGDLNQPETFKESLAGVEKVFYIRVPGSDSFPKIAKEFGVESIVFLSSGAIDSSVKNEIGLMHQQTEELVKLSGLKWTFLRPGAFMSNALQWAMSIQGENVVRAPFGDVGIAPIDPRDIAAVAAEILVSSEHHGKVYTLTGPEVLTPVEQVQILSVALGKEIRFENVPEKVAEENMKKFVPSEIVHALFTLMEDQRKHPAKITDTVEQITGQKARTFMQWAMDNAKFF